MATSAGDAAATGFGTQSIPRTRSLRERLIVEMRSQWILYLMVVPGILYFLIFRYVPMAGTIFAFANGQRSFDEWGSYVESLDGVGLPTWVETASERAREIGLIS